MLSVMRGHVVLRLVTILTILTFFPASVGAWTFTDQMREVVVRTENEFGPLAELPWETVDQLEKGVGNMPWKDAKRFQVAANATSSTNAMLAAAFEIDERKTGALFARFDTSPIERFTVADAGNVEDKITAALQDEVLAENEPATIAIPEELIEQAIQETQERFVLAQAEQTDGNLPSVAAQLEREAESLLNTETEEPKPSEEIERFILAQAETGDPFEGSNLSAPELLVLAQENLSNNQPVDAALNCIELIDRHSRTMYAVGGNTILEGMADEFRKGNFSAQDVAAFEAAMPSFNQLQSLDGKYNVLGFHRIKAKNAARDGLHADGRALLELCISEAQTLIQMDPTNPLQIDIMRVFMASAWEYSPTEGHAAANYLANYLQTQPRNIGRWAAKYVLKKYQGVQGQDMGSARLAAVDLLGFALNDEYVADAIGDPTVYDWVKANLQYVIADAYVTRNRWQDALDKCDQIIQNYPGATPMVESAELMKCYATRRMNSENLYPAIVAYNDFFHNYPESEYASNALWMVGNLYFHSEDYTQAATYYRDVISNYPGSAVATIATDTIDYMNAYLVGTQEAVAEGPKNPEPWMIAQMCGPLALQKLLSTQGINVELKDLAERTGVNSQGTTMLALVETAKHYGVSLTGVELASLESLNSPFIAYVNNNHFVLVKDVRDQELIIADSWKADEVVLAQDFEDTWNGEALVVGPGPNSADRIEIASLATKVGGSDPTFGDDGEDESCGQNNDPPPCPDCCPLGPPPPPPPPPPPGPAPDSPGSAMSALGLQNLDLGISSAGISGNIAAYVSALTLDEPDINIDVDGPMNINFQRNYFSRRGYHLTRRTIDSVWNSNNIGSGWVHNWNYHLQASEATEAQGQPSVISVLSENGATDAYDFDLRFAPWDIDVYRPDANTVNTDRMGYVLVRFISTGKYQLQLSNGLKMNFSTVDGTYDTARLENVEDPDGNKISLTYDGANGTGKLTKIDTPAGDSRAIHLSYSGGQITKAELKKSSTVLQTVEYAYDTNKELTKVTDDAGEDVQYAYDSDATYTDSRFITKLTDKLGYEYDFSYTFKTHHILTNWGFAYVVDLNYPNGLKTTYDRSNTSGGVLTVTNWDNTTLLNKTVYHPGGTFFTHKQVDLFKDATNYDRWEYGYSDGDLTKVEFPGGSDDVLYTYTMRGSISTSTFQGVTTTWEYATAEDLYPTKRVEADSTETEYFYDSDNRVTKTTHPSYASAGWRYEYDADGNLTKTTTPGGGVSTVAYDAFGNPTAFTNALNHTTNIAYDDLGRRTKITDPLNGETEFEYAAPGCSGCASGGNMTKMIDAEGNEAEFEYDLSGRLTKSINSRGIEAAHEYDKENRLTKITAPAGTSNISTIEYDDLGRQTKVTDFEGNDTEFYYDFQGFKTKHSDPIGDTSFTYDAFGNLSTLTDAESQVFKWFYDSDNRLAYHYDDEFKTVHYSYDNEGRMTKTEAGLFGEADPTIYSFNDTTGQITKVEYVSGGATHDANYYYDDEGHITKVADWLESGGNARLYAHDDAGRLTKVTEPDLKSLTYSYDSANRVTSINDYQSKVTSYTYTDAGRLSTITAPGSKTWDYDYEDGFVTKYTHPNDMTTNYEYDDRSRMTKIEHKDGSTVKQGFTYTLDGDGNVTEVEYVGGETWAYFYDGRSRLTKAERDDGAAALEHRYTYTYDDADNLLTKAVYDGSSTTNDIYMYDTANQLTKHGDYDLFYDEWGRLTQKTIPLVETINYDYRYGGKLYEVSESANVLVAYDYGDDGQRKSRTQGATTTNYYYDGWNVINEKTGSTWTTYTFDKRAPVGNILSQVDGDPTTASYEYFAHDILGSTRALYNQSKTEVAKYEYTPFGGDYANSGSASTDYRFTGKGWDGTSDLYHYPYRYYSSSASRWLMRDPANMADGPNMFAYSRGNPSTLVDPMGLDTPGCDNFPDINKCIQKCCASHDFCYDNKGDPPSTTNGESCSGCSWIPGVGSDYCNDCNSKARNCILGCLVGIPAPPDPDNPDGDTHYCAKHDKFYTPPPNNHEGHDSKK